MSDVRWAVYRDKFPLAMGEFLGEAMAPDRTTAEQRGRALFGGHVAVQSIASLTISAQCARCGSSVVLEQCKRCAGQGVAIARGVSARFAVRRQGGVR